jgi:hypothetical protein
VAEDDVMRIKSELVCAVSLSMITVWSVQDIGVGVPVQVPAPETVSVVLPDGTLRVTFVVQLQIPAGMFTVVVEFTTELNAACTSELLQLAAFMVCADALVEQKDHHRETNKSSFINLVICAAAS